MSSVRIRLPDNSERTFEKPPTVLELAQSIGPRLASATLGGVVNGQIVDLRATIPDGATAKIITEKDPEALEVIRHSGAHILAQAVQELWPDVKVTIGPVIDNGFYYDLDSPRAFAPEDLEKIEKKMEEIVKRGLPIVKEVWPYEKAVDTFTKMGERFKVEIINDLKAKGENEFGVYKQGEWFDLCRGPHVQKTSDVKAVKVLSVAGAYWRGDEKNPQLQRIYATAFTSKKDLEHYLNMLEEAKKRDHRKLGKELGLFHLHQLSPGAPFFTPKGAIIYNSLQNYIRELYLEYGYEEVITPQIYDMDLYRISGHADNYADNMYFTEIDKRMFSVKPMNCPGHCVLYGFERKSYRDLPWRVADFGRLHRYEKSGVMHGLTRVRSFAQDDAHIFCTLGQMQGEIESFMKMLNQVYKQLGMERFDVFLSTRPPKRLGSEEVWDKAEGALAEALNRLKIPYKINPGDGAFYGPKLDIVFKDALDRPWQLGTIQCDFNLPERFGLEYIGEDNAAHRPVMLHRAILGSLERFIGVYLEHCAGRLPTWLSPTQVVIVNVTDRQSAYGQELKAQFKARGIRAQFDDRNEKIGYKIREAQLAKIPYMVVIGDREVEQKTLSLRMPDGKTRDGLSVDNFINAVSEEIKGRKLQSSLLNGESGPNGHAQT
ncbi:MAG TPA: threonine--tRNA ligase [Bdellovibrionales bacterium]|nr:threonine--tRNA ligase [Bdellovibrionales bacterium]